MTDRFTFDAGPYVLGALSPEERRAFEEHLETCAECQAGVREFAGLPGLLSRLPADELPGVLEGAAEPPAPVSVLPALLTRAGFERRLRRRRSVLVGIAAALAVGVGSVTVTDLVAGGDGGRPAAAAAVAFTRTSPGIPVTADATVTDVPGGTKIDMTCRYAGQLDGEEREYRLRVVPKTGDPVWLGSWPVLTSDVYGMSVVTPVPRDRIDRFEVVGTTGRTLLTLRP